MNEQAKSAIKLGYRFLVLHVATLLLIVGIFAIPLYYVLPIASILVVVYYLKEHRKLRSQTHLSKTGWKTVELVLILVASATVVAQLFLRDKDPESLKSFTYFNATVEAWLQTLYVAQLASFSIFILIHATLASYILDRKMVYLLINMMIAATPVLLFITTRN